MATLPPLAMGLVDWLIRNHGGAGVPVQLHLHDTNRGQAVYVHWSEQLWAWLWVEEPVQFACGWPERRGAGSKILDYPLVCRQLARHVGELMNREFSYV